MQSVPTQAAAASRKRPAASYGILIWFHWVTLLLVLTAAGLVLARELAEDRELRMLLLALHRQLGMVVLLLTAARLLLRFKTPVESGADAHGLHRALVALTHAAFYLLLTALPVLGLLASQARGQSVQLLGATLPALLARNRDLAEQLLDIHEWAAWVLLAMAGLHAAAALWHHWVRRDDTLRRMLPPVSIR